MKPSISIWHCEYDMVIALIPQCMEDECQLSLSPQWNTDLNEDEEDDYKLSLSLEWNADLNEHEEDCKLSLNSEWNVDLDKDEEGECKLSLSFEWNTDLLPSISINFLYWFSCWYSTIT